VRISQLAARSGIAARTIRFYEQAGLLPAPPRTTSGYRSYNDDAITRLRFVRSAQALGLSLVEIAEVLHIRGSQRARGSSPLSSTHTHQRVCPAKPILTPIRSPLSD
jgi:MerR family transcriptional regulator, copper efflux regulator